MEIKTEISNYYELKEQLWGSNVEYELKQVEDWGMEEEFFAYIESIFSDDIYDITAINDYVAYEYSFIKWIRETKTLDDIDSLEQLEEYAEGDAYDVISNAVDNNDLWEYIQDNYAGETLSNVLGEIAILEPNDYIYFDNINTLSEFINHVKDNDTVMEVIDAVKKANLTDEYWNRLEEECKGVGMTLTNVVDDIESLDIDELIESL